MENFAGYFAAGAEAAEKAERDAAMRAAQSD
jgi:hypothetical protein